MANFLRLQCFINQEDCLFGIYGILTFVGYLMANSFLYKNSSISSNSDWNQYAV